MLLKQKIPSWLRGCGWLIVFFLQRLPSFEKKNNGGNDDVICVHIKKNPPCGGCDFGFYPPPATR
jgi:hypothetical protein